MIGGHSGSDCKEVLNFDFDPNTTSVAELAVPEEITVLGNQSEPQRQQREFE
jgi:hypothetical protein